MKTNLTQKLIGVLLSVFSIAGFAQCPTITNLNVTYGANGTASVSPAINGTVSPSQTMYYWNVTPNATQTTGIFSQQGEFQFPANGTYTICLMFNDSSVACSSNQYCDVINITNTSSTSCQANFTYYTDSACVTHFVNSSVGNNLTYQWYYNGVAWTTTTNPADMLSNGWSNITLLSYSNGVFCDSISQQLYLNCNGTSGSCSAGFATYTDSNCVTHFNNYSTGSNLTYQWYEMSGGFGLLSTQQNPSLNLSQGQHFIGLYTYSNGQFCDSLTQFVNVSCGGDSLNNCFANASFYVFADSVTSGNYYVYNVSSGTGNVSYLWDFGDGSSSTQQYPAHQYTTPGHYVLCLTVTATDGTTTCTSSHCDSSSVQRIAAGFLMSHIAVIPQSTTGIKETGIANNLKVFPNPVSDKLTIETELASGKESIKCMLVDALGKIVIQKSIVDSKTTLDTSELEKGFYFLSIINDGKTVKTIKLVK